MSKLPKAERMRVIRNRLNDATLNRFQTGGDIQAAKGKKPRRKGEAFQERVTADLQKIGKPFGIEEWDIWSCSVEGHGDDFVFSPPAFYRFGFLRIECKHYSRSVEFENIFRERAQYGADMPLHGQIGVPVVVHRVDNLPIMVTMRQDDLTPLSGDVPGGRHGANRLARVPWEHVLQVLARKVAAGQRPDPTEPDSEDDVQS